MKRSVIYPILAEELSYWREQPVADLMHKIGLMPAIRTMEVDGEPISIEVTVSWATAARNSLLIEVVANGPSTWRLERLAESVVIPVH